MADRWIVIPRWDDFQHRDMARSTIPPWIKTYTKLLHDHDYLSLPMATRGVLHGVWMLYASHRRTLTTALTRTLLAPTKGDARYIATHLDLLVAKGFIEVSASRPASNIASERLALEVEVEVEVEKK